MRRRFLAKKSSDLSIDHFDAVSSYPARTMKNIEESDGAVIFSLERVLVAGTKLTRVHANKVGKPVLHVHDARKERVSNSDSVRLKVHALTDFLRSSETEVLSPPVMLDCDNLYSVFFERKRS